MKHPRRQAGWLPLWPTGETAGAATAVNPGGGIETLRIRNAGLAGCFPDTLKHIQNANTGVPGNNLALPFCAGYALPSTVGSIANATPGGRAPTGATNSHSRTDNAHQCAGR